MYFYYHLYLAYTAFNRPLSMLKRLVFQALYFTQESQTAAVKRHKEYPHRRADDIRRRFEVGLIN